MQSNPIVFGSFQSVFSSRFVTKKQLTDVQDRDSIKAINSSRSVMKIYKEDGMNMNIFQMKTKPHGIERGQQFINDNFVCIGWPQLGDLAQANKDEIRVRLERSYKYSGHKLGNALGQVNAFVNSMKNGDCVCIVCGKAVHIGVVGDYVYEQQYDNDKDGMCHRRTVEWIDCILMDNLNRDIQKLMANRNTICQHKESVEKSDLAEIFGKKTAMKKEDVGKLDVLFQQALNILEEELKSEDPERRLKAATELVRIKNK
jgi:predicted Mrr-cat superfamily restriction endonuclease